MNASVDYNGKKEFVKMGSYGIGVSRLVGAIIEAKYNDKDEVMKWPITVSPYDCAIIPMINKNDSSNLEKSTKIFQYLKSKNIDVIIDDTDENISAKIKKFNLIGIPYQLIIGKKTEGEYFEFKEVDGETQKLKIEEIASQISKAKSN
jgi:prolyl-tRNA synthetase